MTVNTYRALGQIILNSMDEIYHWISIRFFWTAENTFKTDKIPPLVCNISNILNENEITLILGKIVHHLRVLHVEFSFDSEDLDTKIFLLYFLEYI